MRKITALQVISKENANSVAQKNVIVTGGNTGIGKETVRALASKGANVYLACKNRSRAESAIFDISKTTEIKGSMHFLELNLASFDSIRSFASEFKKLDIPLHFLINNAGIMACPQYITNNGYESQFAVNHLGHFLLTNLLIPQMRHESPARIVNVSSRAFKRGNLVLSDVNYAERLYNPYQAYSNSKLANVLFTRSLSSKLADSNITAYSVHPGVIRTELTRNNKILHLLYFLGSMFMKTAEEGAATTIHCVCEPDIEKYSGEYFADCQVQPYTEFSSFIRAKLSDEMASQLWEESVEMVVLSNKEINEAFPSLKK